MQGTKCQTFVWPPPAGSFDAVRRGVECHPRFEAPFYLVFQRPPFSLF